MSAQKTHVLPAAASQYLQQFIEERRHCRFCISYGFWRAVSTRQALNPECTSIRQGFVAGFLCERNDQQSKPKGNSCVRDRFPDCPYMTNHRTDQKIHTRSHKPSERSRERKRRRPNGRVVLFWKPKTEKREGSTEESQEKQAGHERP